MVCLASSFIIYWAGLHKEGEKQVLEAGAEAMKKQLHTFIQLKTPVLWAMGQYYNSDPSTLKHKACSPHLSLHQL